MLTIGCVQIIQETQNAQLAYFLTSFRTLSVVPFALTGAKKISSGEWDNHEVALLCDRPDNLESICSDIPYLPLWLMSISGE